MCGRFTSTTGPDELARWFAADRAGVDDLGEDFNVTPTREVYIVRDDGRRRLDTARWGLVPQWAADPSVGARLINARSETASTKPSFRAAFRKRRCLVPTDGFYEWAPVPGTRRKQPYHFRSSDGGPLAFAGLWEQWRTSAEPEGPELRTCAILTGPPNAVVAPVHDRMPIILDTEAWSIWLDPTIEDADVLQRLLVPAPDDRLVSWPVSREVNDVRRHDESLVRPLDEPDLGDVQDRLF